MTVKTDPKKDDSYDSKGNSYNANLKKKYGEGNSFPSWLGRTFDQVNNELGNFRSDSQANNANFVGWLTGGPQDAVPGPLFGIGGSPFDPYRKSSSETLAGLGKRRGSGRAKPGAEEAPAQMTFADYLAMANEMGLGGAGPDYSALMGQLKQNAASGDAKLQAMFNALQGSIDADAVGIGQSYDQAGQALGASGDQARQQINAGYDAARDAQTKQFAALGIGDAAGVLAASGGAAANDQAVANGNVLQNQAANQGQNTQHRASALNYNTNIGNAAGLEGAVQRAKLQQDLATKLAELEGAQSQDQGQSARSSFQAAMQMASNPGLFDPNYQGDPKSQLEAQLLAGQVTAQDLKNQALAANSSGAVGGNLTQYQTLAQAYGVDPSDQEAFLNFIKLVNETR